ITGAWYQLGTNRIQMSVARRSSAQSNTAEILLSKNSQSLLRLVAEISRGSTLKTLGQARLTAEGNGISYSYLLDARNVSLDKPRTPPAGRAKVQVRNKGQLWSGEFDFRAWKYLGLDNAPHLDRVLPDDIERSLKPFRPTLEAIKTFFGNRLRQKRVMLLSQTAPPLEIWSLGSGKTGAFPDNPCMYQCTVIADAAYAACVAGTVAETAGLGILACEVIWVAAFTACMEVC
ncbi:MAG TPA: hypothetical protein VGL91_01075, partial [Acidobacteriota bacterium]